MHFRDKWEVSYQRGENFIYYPKEEVVKFLNRFVRKRTGVDSFKDIIGTNLKGLDFGCGIGRQTILLEEFNIEAYGLDISETAISQARRLARHFGYTPHFYALKEESIPFNDNFFNVAICDSVLDSMPFITAQKYMRELNRTVAKFLYVSLFAGGGEEIKGMGHEQGTVQSYFNAPKIYKLLGGTDWSIKQLYKLVTIDEIAKQKQARHHMVLYKQ